MIQYGDNVDDHENICVRVRGRGQNPCTTQQKQTDRTSLLYMVLQVEFEPKSHLNFIP